MKPDHAPEISVVIPYYNRQGTLLRALDSVGRQSYKDLEIITVDDGSTDTSFDLVEQYRASHPEIRVTNIKQVNQGPSSARNAGVRASRGKYVAFLDSDDSWLPDKLALQMEHLKEDPDLVMLGTNYMVLQENGDRRVAFPRQIGFAPGNYQRMLFKCFFCTPSVVVKREVFTKHGIWFREGKNQSEDSLFFLQVARQFKTGRLPEPLTCCHKEMYGQEGLTADLKGLLRNDLHNVLILAREPDHRGKRLNPVFAGFLMAYMYLKHVKRVLVTMKQDFNNHRCKR